MVEEHGIIITQAAGNFGPIVFTLPEQYSEISDYIFIIGSIFTADVKSKFLYIECLNSVHSYSSKGPLLSGARGVDFVAPGAAITDLPNWDFSKNETSGGTSFAAPNVAGSIACLLSALKAKSIPYSPAMIKMALAKTAFFPEGADKLSFGNGIIQICDAFEFIKTSYNYLPSKLITPILSNNPKQKGILYIQKNKTESKNCSVKIDPTLKLKWILKCESFCGKYFVTHSKTIQNNSFNVKINSKKLEEGSINYAEIYGFDSANPTIGPLFYLPITVICPVDLNFCNEKTVLLKSCLPTYFFLKCPIKAVECSIKITCLDEKKERQITFHYWQLKDPIKRIHDAVDFKFSKEKPVENFSLVRENGQECYEFSLHHQHCIALSFKLEIRFLEKTKNV
uniref:Peptidase S8/S53 domain-containing protein n=1 Tax=Panagrolaimus sp. ES5 TaxID=591445 RepID=A0AC34FNA8_9BILA